MGRSSGKCWPAGGRRSRCAREVGKGGADGIWWSPRTSNPFVGRLRRPRWVRFPHVPSIAGREDRPMNLFPTWLGHPAVIAVVILITILALLRGWWPVLLLVLLVALAQGLHYLLGH